MTGSREDLMANGMKDKYVIENGFYNVFVSTVWIEEESNDVYLLEKAVGKINSDLLFVFNSLFYLNIDHQAYDVRLRRCIVENMFYRYLSILIQFHKLMENLYQNEVDGLALDLEKGFTEMCNSILSGATHIMIFDVNKRTCFQVYDDEQNNMLPEISGITYDNGIIDAQFYFSSYLLSAIDSFADSLRAYLLSKYDEEKVEVTEKAVENSDTRIIWIDEENDIQELYGFIK